MEIVRIEILDLIEKDGSVPRHMAKQMATEIKQLRGKEANKFKIEFGEEGNPFSRDEKKAFADAADHIFNYVDLTKFPGKAEAAFRFIDCLRTLSGQKAPTE